MKDFNKISDFIDGDLPSAEQAEFEQSIKSDSKLKADVNRHQMLVEGIKAARHNELKARLAVIPVTAGIAMRTKIAIGVAAVFTAGMTFFGYQKITASENITPTISTIQAPSTNNTITETLDVINNDQPIIETENELTETTVEQITATPNSIKSNQINSSNSSEKETTFEQVIPNTDFANSFDEVENNQAIKNSEGSTHTNNLNSNKKITKTFIHPTTIEESKTRQYLYDNNNLTLFGDFSTEEYLLLDYRHIDKVFLYFNDSFYELKVKKRKSSLKSSLVTDPTLKAQLRAELQH